MGTSVKWVLDYRGLVGIAAHHSTSVVTPDRRSSPHCWSVIPLGNTRQLFCALSQRYYHDAVLCAVMNSVGSCGTRLVAAVSSPDPFSATDNGVLLVPEVTPIPVTVRVWICSYVSFGCLLSGSWCAPQAPMSGGIGAQIEPPLKSLAAWQSIWKTPCFFLGYCPRKE